MREKCIVCEKEIFRSNNPAIKRQRRGHNCITCSRKCSKIYGNVRKHLRNGERKVWERGYQKCKADVEKLIKNFNTDGELKEKIKNLK